MRNTHIDLMTAVMSGRCEDLGSLFRFSGKKLLMLAMALLMLMLLAVPAAAEGEAASLVEDPDYYARFQGQNITLSVYNWGEYIADGSDGESIDVNGLFEEVSGIKVLYNTFATNEELYAKLKSGGAGYDVIVPSDYMVARMIGEKMLAPLDRDNIPNIRHLDEQYVYTDFDPEGAYSVPYTWGTVGIIYNTQYVDAEEVTTWDILWNERYMGDILMFSNPRDCVSIALKRLGYSMNTTDEKEIREAFETLKDQKALVQAYVMDEIYDKMEGEEAALAPYYAGDAITMMDENPNLAFSVPEEGTNRFIDSLCIPVASKQKGAAEAYINFLCEPEISLGNIDYIGYSTPSLAAMELMDEETSNDPVRYPPQEILDKTEAFIYLPAETNQLLDRLWTELLSNDQQFSRWTIPVFLLVAILFSIGLNLYRSFKKKRGNVS
ncbi:MAG: spermidine/putrescine ABC transporter substrate-binding protein [Oscillospiraceae bacterium]|nr:spermidine/putrescine ABC transporter substrate-binding protein [Oscillospiraceae bacterium]